MKKNIPPTVLTLIPYNEDASRAVAAWMAEHKEDYLLKDPALMLLDGKTYVWCYGTAAHMQVTQAQVIDQVKQELGVPSGPIALAGYPGPGPTGPRLHR